MSAIKITLISALLCLALLGNFVVPAVSAPSPAPQPDPEIFGFNGFVNYTERYAFYGDLASGDASAASRVLEENVASAYASGNMLSLEVQTLLGLSCSGLA